MKLYMKLSVILLTLSMFIASCSKYVEGYNVSPNDPENASAATLLSGMEVGLFALYGGGQLDRSASIMVQQTTGISDQMVDVTRYNILEGDNVNEWELIYTDILVNARVLLEKYGDDSPHYAGVTKVIQALALGIATDFWGDIPYSDALSGLDNLNPSYDSQEAIITEIKNLCDAAITDLGAAESIFSPDGNDYIHSGDLDAWKNTARMLKIRYMQRLTKKASYNAQEVIDALTNAGFTGPENDTYCIFGTNGNEFNQWYAFHSDRGYMRMCETFIKPLRIANDPRLPFYADTTGQISTVSVEQNMVEQIT
jgi:hypothetical protein